MAERIMVDSDLAPAIVPVRVLNEMANHAIAAASPPDPEECCGLLVGSDERPYSDVVRCRNEMTRLHREDPQRYPRDGGEAFHMNEEDYLAAQKEAEARGWRVTAIYHSHVGYGVYFSERDQEYAAPEVSPFPDAEHFVLSVFDRKVQDYGSFFHDGSPGRIRGRSVAPEHS